MNRRRFIHAGSLSLLAFSPVRSWAAAPAPAKVPIATAFDREVEAFMETRKIPGGALAVVKDRRLVYARGYGWADRDKKLPATPDSLFRLASISKPITAVAVLKLVEEKRLALDAPAFHILRLPAILVPSQKPDPRLERITIRQLLQHTGGWDRDKSFDPMFRSSDIAKAAGEDSPASASAVIRYMLGQPLDFDPGTRYAYSNFGYCVLGRLIEKVTGQTYEQYVREKILALIGIRRMRLGTSLEGKSAEGEVRYYTTGGGRSRSVFHDHLEKVLWPYGSFCLEAMDAHGGWIASAVDLARFAAALDDPNHSSLLKPETFPALYAPPPAPVSRKPDGSLNDSYYACGWSVRPIGKNGKANYWHNGSLPGTSTLLVRRADGLSWAALFNQRSEDKTLSDGAIDSALHRAAAAVAEWPAHNLFEKT